MTKVLVCASPPNVIASYETRLNAFQKGFKVKKAGRNDAKTLDALCAKPHSPRFVNRFLRDLGFVPERELADRCGNDPL